MKRLTSNSSGLLTLRDFSLNLFLVFKAQWFELGVLRYQPLNWALVAKEENAAKAECFRANVHVFLAKFPYFNF